MRVMERAGHRRRWGISGLLSVGAHGGLVIGCLLGVGTHYQHLAGQHTAVDAAESAISFDLVQAAEAAPEPATKAVSPEPPAPILTPRQGHAFHRSRPAATTPIRLPADAAPLEPPVLDDPLGEEDEQVEENRGAIASVSPVPPAAPPEPQAIPAHEATYLRTYETYPSLPRSLWVSGRVYSVLAQVCVSTDGRVSNVRIKSGAAPELDRAVTSTLSSWRYRPRVVEGTPRPFCHLLKLDFSLR
jgi:hypothetical protein